MNVSMYQAKVYPSPPCWELAVDVLTTERGVTATAYKTISGSVRSIASAFRLQLHKSAHGFEQVAEPVDFAVVLMGRTPRLGIHHCGIFYGGKVLHATDSGTFYQPLAQLQAEYQVIEFWARADA
ncbi:MAG: hypothetical protein K0S48_4 [Ramlibacter sp.]|jgi:hypothetical protein|nr:hypothetical protein [Ramlibacter sp.]